MSINSDTVTEENIINVSKGKFGRHHKATASTLESMPIMLLFILKMVGELEASHIEMEKEKCLNNHSKSLEKCMLSKRKKIVL